MKALKDLILRSIRTRCGPCQGDAKTVALEKRRLERLLRDEGLSRNAAGRVVRVYFAPPQN